MNILHGLKRNNQGRLLLSLLITMGIVALLSVITIPYLKEYQPNLMLNGVARDLTSDLRYAQQLTITEQVVHMVKMYYDEDEYKILRIDTSTTTIKEVAFPLDVNYQQITNLTNNEAVFNSYGGVNESGSVILINSNNKQATINIKPSGYIQLTQ